MKSFAYKATSSIGEAVATLDQAKGAAVPMGGGTDLVGLMKNRIVTPEQVVDLKMVDGLEYIRKDASGYTIGAATTVADVQYSKEIADAYPVLSQAASVIASQQIRNQGTVGGNLCQRPRCWYFRNTQTPCLRRDGTYCSAVLGENKYHAILGGAGCFIVHPSDLAPALIALDAKAKISGPQGSRTVALEDFFVLPKEDLHHETILKDNEILEEVQIPAPMPGSKQVYLKHRIRQVWDFAILSCALQIQVQGNAIRDIRLVLGAVAPKPWRCHTAENILRGAALTPENVDRAIKAELAKARPMTQNAYKIDLAAEMMRQALLG
ncbi:MAG: yagS [Firmicutes bacterium]|nr:yagS [Bacillota bacterium]